MKSYQSIEAYYHQLSDVEAEKLQELHEIIKKAAPGAEEFISYGMPAFKQNRVLVYYAAAKNHIGFYPTPGAIVAFSDRLSHYKTSKGAIQFPWNEPLPATLVHEMVQFRIAEDMKLNGNKKT